VLIAVPVGYATIANGEVEIEVFTTAEARAYLLDVTVPSWDRWKRLGWIPSLTLPGMKASLFTKHDLDWAASVEDSPVRNWIRSKTEQIEEVLHG